MRELAEFRFFEEDARKYLDPEDGEVLGDSVCKLVIDVRDARVALEFPRGTGRLPLDAERPACNRAVGGA